MGYRHFQVREANGLLGEVWSLAAPFKRQDLLLLQNTPLRKSSFTLAACSLAHGMESCPSAADPSMAQCCLSTPPAPDSWLS